MIDYSYNALIDAVTHDNVSFISGVSSDVNDACQIFLFIAPSPQINVAESLKIV